MIIQILTTGGTIDKVYFDAASEYTVGEPTILEILRNAGSTVDVRVDALMRKDSLDMTPADRDAVVEHVRSCGIDRVLITHGTDTMVETARALREIDGKTIVLVGSLSPARFKASDAEFNIGFAFAAVQVLPPGVYLAMNGRIFHPDRVTKNRNENRFEPV
jgi:L-asparaginase